MREGDGSRDRLEPISAHALRPDDEEAFAAEASAWLGETSTPTAWDAALQFVKRSRLPTGSRRSVPTAGRTSSPVLAVWDDGRLFFSAEAMTREARSLDHDPIA
jgi:hypothetical protein